jgi:dTDP-4-amino-4,6-dideoxygalactose transaminase
VNVHHHHPIPVANPLASYLARKTEIDAAVHRVLNSGWYILGPEVEGFEAEFAAFLNIKNVFGVANGTDALEIALRALDVQAGDEVILPSHTAVATAAAVKSIGATPVFADIDPVRKCLDPARLEELLSDKTKALIAVHIYGQPADMAAVSTFARNHGIALIEDCAQSCGAAIGGRATGSWGDIAAFSFYPTKNLGALGDGGAVVTNNSVLAQRIRELRQYGWTERYVSSSHGLNSRLDELQAAVLRVRLEYLSEENERRRQIASSFNASIRSPDIVPPMLVPETLHAMHLYVVQADDRQSVRAHLMDRGIHTALHYPLPVHLQPAFNVSPQTRGSLSETELLAQKIVTLPLYPELTEQEVSRICEALQSWQTRG